MKNSDTPTSLPGVMITTSAVLLVIAGLGAAWSNENMAKVLTAEEISGAPPGCVAEQLRARVASASQPVTRGTYAEIERDCRKIEVQQRSDAESNAALTKQKEAIGVAK